MLLTAPTGALAPKLGGVLYESRGRRTLRNGTSRSSCSPLFEPPPHSSGLPHDPVCRMAVDPDRAAGRLTYEETAYFFCSLACAARFAAAADRFTPQSPRS